MVQRKKIKMNQPTTSNKKSEKQKISNEEAVHFIIHVLKKPISIIIGLILTGGLVGGTITVYDHFAKENDLRKTECNRRIFDQYFEHEMEISIDLSVKKALEEYQRIINEEIASNIDLTRELNIELDSDEISQILKRNEELTNLAQKINVIKTVYELEVESERKKRINRDGEITKCLDQFYFY